jgi:uncharacterized repeat protein (TIGR03847 family)
MVSRRIMEFDEPERFAVGTMGEPGERTFFLQAVQGTRISAVALEKEQLAILADRLLVIIDELERRGLAAIHAGPTGAPDERPLREPLQEEFHVETLMIGWDKDLDRLVIEARSQRFDGGAGESAELERPEDAAEDEIHDDAPLGPDVLRVRLTPPMAQRFARSAERVLAADRPACPFCGQPLGAAGHLCPRRGQAGYRH